MILYRIYKKFNLINFKSIIFNLKYFDFKTAIKLPVLIHKNTTFLIKKGTIVLPEKTHFGMIKFGHGGAFFDSKEEKSIWQLKGKIIFKGYASFGNGTTVSVLQNAELIIGNNFSCGSNSKILCRKKIEFGSNCLLSWNITIMDTDFHRIINQNKEVINIPKPILIEDKVWIGCHSLILKGTKISKGSIVASNSTISKSNNSNNVIIASNKQIVIKENIEWIA